MGKGAGKDGTYVWANNGSDDRSWYDDATYPETGKDQETPRSVERISP